MAEPVALKYRAFISYSHRDKKWCEWLHRSLEGFRIGKDLVGRRMPRRPILIPFIGIRNPSGDALPRSIPHMMPS